MLGPLLLAALAAPSAAPEAVSFGEAVRRAMERSPPARVAADEIVRADGLLWQARAGSLPALAAAGAYTTIDHARTLQGRVTQPREQWSATAALSVPLFAPSRWATWVAGARLKEAAEVSAADVARQVALLAGRSYLAVIAAKRAVEVSRSAVELAQARLEFAKTRLQGGVGNALDEARAEQVHAASEAQLETARTGLARAQEALGIATGVEGPLDAGEDPDLAGPAPGREPPEERRADVAAAKARLEAVAAVARYSWADWLPTLLATAQGVHLRPVAAPTPTDGWQVQLVLSLPIFEGGLRVGQLREREALEREARTAVDATLRQARSEVRVSVEAVQHQEAAFAAAKRAAEQARSVLSLTTRAYEAGASNSLDLTTAQQQSRDADLAMVISEDAVRQARLDLLAAVGLFP